MTYRELRDKVVSITSNRVAMAEGPVPMEIGNVENEEEEQDVAAVGRNMQCHTCSGWGHTSRECPSKGGKSGGKGGKGSPRGGGGGDSSTRSSTAAPQPSDQADKAETRTCFSCGKKGGTLQRVAKRRSASNAAIQATCRKIAVPQRHSRIPVEYKNSKQNQHRSMTLT